MTLRLLDVFMDRHEVLHLADAVGGQKPRDEHVGVGQVELLDVAAAVDRCNLEPAALVGVEDAAEDARRIEARRAEPVDRAVGGDQGDRVHVPDHAVVLDGGVAHRLTVVREALDGARTTTARPWARRRRYSEWVADQAA
jgi:hypothetical protein